MDTSTALHEKVLCDPGGQEQSKEGSGVDDRIAIFHLLARGRATTGVVRIGCMRVHRIPLEERWWRFFLTSCGTHLRPNEGAIRWRGF